MNMFAWLYTLNGFMAIIGVLYIMRKIGPNHFVGIRICKTLGNETLWYEAHVFVGWSVLVTSAVSVVVLASLHIMKRYWNTNLPAELIGALVSAVLLLVGYGLIPLMHVLKMPGGSETSERRGVSDILRSDIAIILYVIVAVVLVMTSLPAAFNRVGPNGHYGFRTAKTLSSEAVWYASNRFSGWANIIAGCVSIVGLLILRFGRRGGLTENGYTYLLMNLVPIIAGIAASIWYVYGYL